MESYKEILAEYLFHPHTKGSAFHSAAKGSLYKIDHILGHVKKTVIIPMCPIWPLWDKT